MSSTMLIGETPSSDGGIDVFSSVKTRPFSALSGDGFGLAHGAGKGQRFGPFSGIFLQAEKAEKKSRKKDRIAGQRFGPFSGIFLQGEKDVKAREEKVKE